MNIWSQYRPGIFWLEPETYGHADAKGRRDKIPGVLIEFTTLGPIGSGSILNTDERYGDKPELKAAVEGFFMNHMDWGTGALRLADESIVAGAPLGPGCQVMTPGQGGVRVCGRPLSEGYEVCDIHAAQFPELVARETSQTPPMPAPPETARI